MAVPLGVLGGIYLNEYGGTSKFAGARALPLRDPHRRAVDRDGPVHLHVLGAAPERCNGLTGFAGSLALGMPHAAGDHPDLRGDAASSCPRELREGSLALGSRKSRTIRTVVLPHAAPGIVSGALLAVARAAGETAPLLFTIGAATSANWNLLQRRRTTRCRSQIFGNANSPFDPGAGAGVRGRVHPDRDRVHRHRARPHRDRDLHPADVGRTGS